MIVNSHFNFPKVGIKNLDKKPPPGCRDGINWANAEITHLQALFPEEIV